eukprot:jgi/Bigna1/86713/estExt_fgenesh1_pg.C_130036
MEESKERKGTDVVRKGKVAVQALPGRKVLLRGVKQTLQVVIQIHTDDVDTKERPRMQVSCVMDKSGSMQLDKRLTYAKHGVRKFIKHLTKNDMLNVVVYSGNAECLIKDGDLSDENKPNLVSVVKKIQPDGPTNMHAGENFLAFSCICVGVYRCVQLPYSHPLFSVHLLGMEIGVQLLREAKERDMKEKDYTPAIQRMFVFSDGQVNEGVQEPKLLYEAVENYVSKHGITINSFGIGEDFNEDLMTGLARVGKGGYYYLKNARVIPGLVSKSIHRLFQTLGTEGRLQVRGINGAVVTRIFGDEESSDGNDALVDGHLIGDIHADNLRQILLEVEVSPSSSSPASTEILEFQLDYKQRPSQRPSQDDDDDRKLEAIISAANIPKDTLLKLKSIKMNMISSLSQMKEEDWQKLSSRSGIKPGHVVRLRRYLDERVNSKEDDHPPPLKNINSSVKQVSIKGTLSINFTDDTDKVRKQKVCDEVLIARAIQDASLLEPEIDGCLERGDKKNAKKVQEQSLRSLKAAYDRVSDKEMGGAKILATCIKRGEELMENLKTDLDARALQLEARENAAQFRAMSFCQVISRADSQSEYSDDEGGLVVPADFMRRPTDSLSDSDGESHADANFQQYLEEKATGTPAVSPSANEERKCSIM